MALDFHSYTPGQKASYSDFGQALFCGSRCGIGQNVYSYKTCCLGTEQGSGTDGGVS